VNLPQLGIIFDMDGVLVDSYHAHYQSWLSTARGRGLSMTEEAFAKTFGRTSRDIIRTLWGEDFSETDVRAFDEEKEASFRDILKPHFPAMPGSGA
jgi:beta-phosphoglucomutase